MTSATRFVAVPWCLARAAGVALGFFIGIVMGAPAAAQQCRPAAGGPPCETAGGIASLADPDGSDLTVTISDDGPGIPEQELESVFEPFYRVEASRNRDTGGTGLGLSIARDIVQAHGGSIRGDTILNPQGQAAGARFTLLLPRGTPPTDLGDEVQTHPIDA